MAIQRTENNYFFFTANLSYIYFVLLLFLFLDRKDHVFFFLLVFFVLDRIRCHCYYKIICDKCCVAYDSLYCYHYCDFDSFIEMSKFSDAIVKMMEKYEKEK